MTDINSIFPIIDIQDGKMLNSNEVISVAFQIEYPEIFLQSKEYYNSIQERLSVFLKQLPDYTILQTISLFDEEEYDPDFSTPDNFLQKHNKLHYLKRKVPTEIQYIILSFAQKPLAKNLSGHSITDTLKYLYKNPYENYKKDLDIIEGNIANAVTSLEGLFDECNLKRLSNDEIALMLYRYFSLDYNYSGSVNNLIIPTYNFKNNTAGEYNLGVISVYEGREATSYSRASQTRASMAKSEIKQVRDIGNIAQSQMFPLTIGLPFKHAYCVIIQKLNIEKLMFEFEFEERALAIPATFGLNQAINKLRDIAVFKACLHDEGYTPTSVSIAVIIPDKNKQTLNMKLEATKSAIANISEMRGIIEKEESELTMLSHSPGNGSSSYKNNLTTSIHAVSYLPKESHYKSDAQGFPFTDRYGKKIFVDILNNKHMTNKNGIVIGPSGRGKSYTLNYIVSLIYNEGHVFIIDKGGSYKRICDSFGGMYLDSANEDNFRFSIFETTKDFEGNYLVEGVHKSFVLSVLIFIWKQGEKARPEEKEILSNLVDDFYETVNKEKNTVPTFTGFYSFVADKSQVFNDAEKRFFDYESFLLMAKPYALGDEKKLLNSNANIDLTYEKLTVFEMGAIEKANPVKFNLLCLIITFLNIKKIQKLPRHIFKSFIIDEALSFLKGDIGDFIGNLYAEIRKENGQVLVVAQGLNFLLEASTEVQEKIFNNRDFIVMTNHEGYGNVFQNYKSRLDFSDKDIELLSSVTRNEEIFMRLGNHGMILRVDVSLEEHGLFTTHPKEMKLISELEKHYGSIQAGVVAFAENKRMSNNK
ncbi:hypothetical protein [uncultured Flavobacterium sp.]|uniref:TraG/VirB4 family ATPase n=1 Tax=uncultured Flavobacterium sp. TaxID=165435 RepID=UPI002592AAF8|nr:hypothetical protein [uncultured Flavobacterium sp.]